ncbi:MAG TPA: HAMP domain-containing sensor histidine kinase [Chitinophaga sp.]|uniref:sensor histidine kinase n=1 Tax=Chitinophaga sp. TaxID=1869181 RepID=UPI002C0524C3|nr:HAMP domain-containing sensor histidine kinase [Chitinophaga sp.]HVI43723.1 HAMP domain-containing sensor histidine kinase [Chitinophaga sp.]
MIKTITFFAERMRKTFRYLIGPPQEVSLENRIFHFMCLASLLIFAYNIPFNYFTGLKVTALIFVLLLPAMGFLYYLSRFKGRSGLSIAVSVIMVNIMFAFNYFYSEGIQGASFMTFILTFFLVMLLSPRNQYVWWLAYSILLVTTIVIYEYLHPASVTKVYTSRVNMFIDLLSTYIITVVMIFFGTLYIKRAYNKEKERGEEKTRVLETMNTEKNKLFSIISHDLRSPIASIQSYLELMKNIDLPPEDKKELEAELLHMVNNTQDMLYNMLLWSKTQLQGHTVNLAAINMEKVIMPVIRLNEPLLQKKNINLDHRIDPDITVKADMNMLQLIVRNLIGNAIKFTKSGGSIYIETTRQQQQCVLVVKDTGTGIPMERQQEIFSLKVRSTFGTANEKGIGLGLYLCKEYANAQSGNLWFESIPLKGSTFYLSLPTAETIG